MSPILEYDGQSYEAAENETVLDTLLRAGHDIPNSCRAGACQCCMMRAVSGTPTPQSQVGLKPALKEQGYFLSCSCTATCDMTLESPGEEFIFPSRILATEDLGANVMLVKLAVPEAFSYRAGQFITVTNPCGVSRSYSLASLPGSDELELHVRRVPGGLFTTWLFEQAEPGDEVKIAGPAGECFYTAGNAVQPMILIGTGTGLAPLVGIVRDALQNGHTGPIHLYHGALDPTGLYFCEQLSGLADEFEQFYYQPCVLRDGDDHIVQGAIDQIVLERHTDLKPARAFLCGNPDLVKMLKKKLFLAGMNMKEIAMDAFIPSAAPAA